jgi:RHS repeat-associated protein
LLTDGLGSVRQELAGGNLQTTTTYEPYGRLLTQTGTSGTAYGFTGEQEDSATGLLYLRARYYNPSLHTFMVKDSWAGDMLRPETLHPYSYVGGNVINITDPTGQCYGPLRYLRQLESTNCNNLDMAGSIFTNPNASVMQRAGAATYATAMVGSHAMLAVGTAASGGFGQGLLAYSAGYGGYDMARTNTNSNLLTVPGYILGYENIHRDLITLNNPCASTAQKVVAGGDALLNTVLGATLFSGVANSARSIRTAWQLRHLSSAERLVYLQRLGAQSGVEVIESTRFYRPPGTHIIEIPSKALNNASRAAGGYYHELAHVGQEFGKVSTLRGGRFATLSTQGFQAWSARAGGSALEIIPGYLL